MPNPVHAESPGNDDDKIVPSSMPVAHSPEDEEEVPPSLPPFRQHRSSGSDSDEEQTNDSNSDEDKDYATAEAFSSYDENVPISVLQDKK